MPEENTGTDLQPEGQPSPEDATPDAGDQAPPEGQESSFLDDYDLGDITDPQAKAVAEATVKRLNAAYTRQRQADAQQVRNAQESQEILDGLLDPDRAPAIAQALGLTLAEAESLGDEFGDEFADPNERIDALEQQLAQQQQLTAAEQRVQAENAYVTEQIESLESKLEVEFGDEEIELLYLLADEHRDQNGAPDVEAAHRILDAIGASHHVRASKPRPRPPRRPGQGTAGERTVDLSNREERLKAGAAAVAELRASAE